MTSTAPCGMVRSTEPPAWLALLGRAAGLFVPDRLAALTAPVELPGRGGAVDETARIARHWLSAGGKRLRPFVMLAAVQACRAGPGPQAESLCHPRAADRVAVAIEAFHKASLAHDDIEDDDDQRYGRPTLHRQFGRAMAINVGDYLLGLGYRLLCAAGEDLPAPTGAAILARMSRAHVLLAQGQGAELAWRRAGSALPSSAKVLRAYALKTAPAFAAALSCGVLLGGGDLEGTGRTLESFSRQVGVAFQVLNDLADWRGDLRARRPTYLTALAAEAAGDADRAELVSVLRAAGGDDEALQRAGQRLDALGTFDAAQELLRRLRGRGRDLAGRIRPAPLGELAAYLVELILG